MLLDRNKYTEAGYIGEELIGDTNKQLDQRCLAVQHSMKDKDFSTYEETLAAYHVTDAEYKLFIGKTAIKNIFVSFSGSTSPIFKKDFLEIYENMLFTYFPSPSNRVISIAKGIEEEANEVA
ncbi:hypothetical protein ACRQ5D_31170 [Mucilaginibacter sp. P25]|uniref:Uncharacterized protein n=2 Tax=Mucilaginibacter gossypiicola TaxID=551995 RepID=A0A1H8AVF3_9SPHI|nr:hypothetical protein [Mucilaginibacter sp. SMC90]UOE52263.1 hypothetical protein MTO98_14360 [Mucilaginibacter sp. SMC90]SEM73778.1 hypothetical protein SAMN05192574_101651 [Mucilaginibacter gossypiicola]